MIVGHWRRMVVLLGLVACRGGNHNDQAGAEPGAEPSHVVEKDGEVGVSLDSATVARIGLETAALRPAVRGSETELPAMVVADPEATSFVRAGVSGRLTAVDGAAWPRFGGRVESGESLAVIADARPVLVAKGGTVSRVLAQPGELVQAGQELLEITRYDVPLVQVAWGDDLPTPPAAMEFSAGSHRRVHGTLVGPAPEADPVTREPAYLYRVAAGWQGMRPGAAVSAWLADPGPVHGVVVPSGAVVQWDALAWTYAVREPGRFVRVRVPTDHPVPGGWLVGEGLRAGDEVVTRGAGQLLSEEFRARIVVGEEVGE